MRKIGRTGGLGLAILIAGASGCASKPAAKLASDVKPAPAAEKATVVRGGDEFRTTSSQEPVAEALPQSVQEINRKGYLKDSFFDFDRYDVRPDQRDRLVSDAEWLRKWPSVKILVEGHCDERGTAQYNMALGEKRAQADKEYLQSLGVDASRIRTVSFGKEHPFSNGHDEASWALDRRDHIVATAR